MWEHTSHKTDKTLIYREKHHSYRENLHSALTVIHEIHLRTPTHRNVSQKALEKDATFWLDGRYYQRKTNVNCLPIALI